MQRDVIIGTQQGACWAFILTIKEMENAFKIYDWNMGNAGWSKVINSLNHSLNRSLAHSSNFCFQLMYETLQL